MNTKRHKTIIIEDSDQYSFKNRVDEVINRYYTDQIVNIDTGMFYNGTNSNGYYKVVYYAIIIAENIDEE